MFPEYREVIDELKLTDLHFVNLHDRHTELDEKIRHMEAHIVHATHEEIENLKKEKLLLKDQAYKIILQALAAQQ